MPLYKGTQEVDMVYLGNQEVAQIYKGTQEVWTNYKIINLGSGKSFNIKELFPDDYQNFTASNFFVNGANGNPNVSGRITGDDSGPVMGINIRLIKSYNANTGILSCYYLADGEETGTASVSVNAVLIMNVEKALSKNKLIYLGNGRSFSIASAFPDEYQNFTNANFVIESATMAQTGNRYYGGTFTCSGYGQLVLNYNSSTGVLSVGNNLIITNSGGGYLESQYRSVKVYLSRKALS